MNLRIALLLAAAVAAACAPLPVIRPGDAPDGPGTPSSTPLPRRTPPPGGFPRSAEQVSGPAVLALLAQAREAQEAGRPEQAAAKLEHALRIERRNAFLWQALASVHLAQNLPDEAESTAQKSNSLALGNPFLEIENWRTIAAARRARGDLAGVEEAERRVTDLQELLGQY